MAPKVIVVDDEADFALMLKRLLEDRGFACSTAGDGSEGLELIERTKPQLAVIDILMPKLNGYEMLNALRESPRFHDLPIIIMTSLTADEETPDQKWMDRLGVAGFFSKPFEPRQLVSRIEEILGLQPETT
jgi:CheY-like chemotaxis protein